MRNSPKAGIAGLALACMLATPGLARADVITDWNDQACAIAAKVGPGSAGHRIMAIVQVSVYDAVSSIDRRYKPYLTEFAAPAGASVEAAVAAANHAVLVDLVPGEKLATEAAYQSALSAIPDGQAKAGGISAGEKAASAILARAAADGSDAADTYQPRTTPGVYVPTTIPVFATWTRRKPWIMARPDQFRPGPPPDLASDTWVRDYNEVKALGGRNSSQRTPQQTEIARFWEETRPLIYHPLLRSVATLPGRTVAQNARLYAAGTVAIDDALIAVYDAKYTFHFWRPITAIRNGGGNKATAQETGWTPLITTPMHPEYPCAHCISLGALTAVIQAEVAGGPMPVLSTSSPTAGGVTREWKALKDLTEEVEMARIYDGVHYRNSTDVGTAMGQRIGKLVAEKF
jgi:hypothetical protein